MAKYIANVNLLGWPRGEIRDAPKTNRQIKARVANGYLTEVDDSTQRERSGGERAGDPEPADDQPASEVEDG